MFAMEHLDPVPVAKAMTVHVEPDPRRPGLYRIILDGVIANTGMRKHLAKERADRYRRERR